MGLRKKVNRKDRNRDHKHRSMPRQKRKRHDNGEPHIKFQVRTDAGPSAFLTTELEAMMAELYREELPDIRVFDFFPVSTEIPSGAETIAWRMLTPVGLAAIIREPSSDIPRVDLYVTKATSDIHEMAVAYGYTLSELENAAYTGMPLDSEKARVAREVMLRTASDIAINGGAAYGVPNLPGIFSNTNIPTVTAVDPGGGTEWVNKTADQILFDMNDAVTDTMTATNGIEVPDSILLPLGQYEHVSTLRVGDTGETVLSYFLRTNPHISRVDWMRELDGIGTAGADVMLVYRNDPSKLKYHMPLPFQQRPAQESNMEIVINCREKTGGVVIPKPLSLRIVEGI